MGPFVNTPQAAVPDKLKLAREEYFNQPDGFPFDTFDVQEVNLPPLEAEALVDDPEADSDQEGEVPEETGFGSSVGVSRMAIPGLKMSFDARIS